MFRFSFVLLVDLGNRFIVAILGFGPRLAVPASVSVDFIGVLESDVYFGNNPMPSPSLYLPTRGGDPIQ